MMLNPFLKFVSASALLLPVVAVAQDLRGPTDLETARTLPRNVRNPRFKTIFTQVDERYDADGVAQPIAAKLNKVVTFADVIAARETALEKAEVKALLANAGLKETDGPGYTTGDISIRTRAFAPVLAWGILDRWTVAVALPVYFVGIDADVGFVGTKGGHQFVEQAAKNGPDKANEAAGKLNNAINEKLTRLGYAPISSRSMTAVGDLRIVNKVKVLERGSHLLGLKAELVAPTGKVAKPNDLLSLPLGDGQWDLGAGVVYDLTFFRNMFRLTTHMGYVAQLPGQVTKRLPTSDIDALSADEETIRWDVGDVVSAGTSLAWEIGRTGVTLGAGYVYQFMNQTRFTNGRFESFRYRLLENDFPIRDLHSGILTAGYSTFELFREKKFPLPLQANLSYSVPMAGRNVTNNPMVQAELVLFF